MAVSPWRTQQRCSINYVRVLLICLKSMRLVRSYVIERSIRSAGNDPPLEKTDEFMRVEITYDDPLYNGLS
jgi:hypothetical protein